MMVRNIIGEAVADLQADALRDRDRIARLEAAVAELAGDVDRLREDNRRLRRKQDELASALSDFRRHFVIVGECLAHLLKRTKD